MNRALVIGVSKYPPPVPQLPAVSADVREIGRVLRSANGSFRDQEVVVLADHEADRSHVLEELERVFTSAKPDDTVFVYMAGHGGTVTGEQAYHFVAHDSDLAALSGTGVPLAKIKQLFDRCRSRRVFLWLDFCHSGGILARRLTAPPVDDSQVIARTLDVVQGEGKIIFAACTPQQYAYESAAVGHGLFTASLLEGLKGAAASAGEVTAASLYEFIDRRMGSDRQRPMFFGHMTGRIVLMHYSNPPGRKQVAPNGKNTAGGKKPAGTKAAAKPVGGKKAVAAGGRTSAVDSSGNWALLDKGFFETRSVRHNSDGTFTLEIPSRSAEVDAAVRRLRPGQYGRAQPVAFAHRNEGVLARITEVEAVSAGAEQLWTVKLVPENVGYGGGIMDGSVQVGQTYYSPEDITRLRVGRVLLNDPPPPREERRGLFGQDAMMEGFIRGHTGPVSITHCAVQAVFKDYRDRPRLFLQLARLASVYTLKAGGVVEDVLELSLGPIRAGKVHVRFRGTRRQHHQAQPTTVEVEGDCPVE